MLDHVQRLNDQPKSKWRNSGKNSCYSFKLNIFPSQFRKPPPTMSTYYGYFNGYSLLILLLFRTLSSFAICKLILNQYNKINTVIKGNLRLNWDNKIKLFLNRPTTILNLRNTCSSRFVFLLSYNNPCTQCQQQKQQPPLIHLKRNRIRKQHFVKQSLLSIGFCLFCKFLPWHPSFKVELSHLQ